MTGLWPLDWATLGVSLLNFMLLTWLAFTVWLNADRRDWGVWFMSGGLLVGSVFFICHTAILGQQEVLSTMSGLNIWWHIGWLPVIIAPVAWYVVALWYAGYWNNRRSLLWHHRIWLGIAIVQSVLLIGLFVVSNPIPDFDQLMNLNLTGALRLDDIPLIFMLAPVFMVICIVLSIDALLHPAPAKSTLSKQARQRSRPWLFGTATILLAVCLSVAVFIFYFVYLVSTGQNLAVNPSAVAIFDLLLSFLIAVAVFLLGQAIVAYEVFTGKALPRRGLVYHWRTAILVAIGCSTLVSGSLALSLRPVYSLLLITLLLIISYAVYAWRSFVARETFTAQLRPFVTSERLVNSFVNSDPSTSTRAQDLFNAVCRNVLGTQKAQLIPLGSLASLAGPPLHYPDVLAQPMTHPLLNWAGTIQALDPGQSGGYCWSVPLWAERGVIGVMLIGTKGDDGLYTQEEIEIARASGERIVDMLAAEQMATRLMQLQRQRLTETQVMDFRTRRLLHDEVLPALHSTLLQLSRLSKENSAIQVAVTSLIELHGQISELIHSARKSNAVNAPNIDFVTMLQNLVETEFQDEFEAISWALLAAPQLDKVSGEILLGAAREVIRNAAVHGRGNNSKRTVQLAITIQLVDSLNLIVSDNGVGLNFAIPTSKGSGNGLALHSTLLAIIGGYLSAEPLAAGGTKVTISIPAFPGSSQGMVPGIVSGHSVEKFKIP